MASKWLNYTIRDGMGELSLKKCYGPVWIRWAGHLATRALHVGDTSAGMLLRNGKHERNRGRSQVPAFHHNPLSDRFVEKILRRFKKRLRREQMPHDKRMKHTHTYVYIYIRIYIYSHIHTDKYTNIYISYSPHLKQLHLAPAPFFGQLAFSLFPKAFIPLRWHRRWCRLPHKKGHNLESKVANKTRWNRAYFKHWILDGYFGVGKLMLSGFAAFDDANCQGWMAMLILNTHLHPK